MIKIREHHEDDINEMIAIQNHKEFQKSKI